eukprot:COSAG04_NODE_12507_length_649_cov_1.309091_3_plen_77_part_01
MDFHSADMDSDSDSSRDATDSRLPAKLLLFGGETVNPCEPATASATAGLLCSPADRGITSSLRANADASVRLCAGRA